MSTPSNRLSQFRTYSYYHVLAMCDCSATADALAQSQTMDVWEHATPQTMAADERPQSKNLGRYAPKRVEGSGKYIILINGSTDAAYVITDAKWSTATAAAAVPGDRSTSIAVEGSLKVSEPKGIAFLDQVVQCSIALGVDAAQVVFVLKTVFVGHAFDSQTGDFQDTITDIPPINFIAYDVTGSFTEMGGSYDIQFVAAAHGAARLPQYGKAVNAMSLTADSSLETTLRRLQDNINTNYEKYFNCVYSQIESTNGGPEKEAMLKSLRKVKYVIEVGDDYADKNGQVKYTVTNQPQQFKNTSGCGDRAQVTFPASTSIEGAISTIMLMCPQVQSDMSVGDTSTGVKYEYKVHTALKSTPVDGADENTLEYTVYYRVERFMVPKTLSYVPAFQTLGKDSAELKNNPDFDRIKRNIIEFDYMYTGKNIDILEFDMKVNMGMAYLQTATLANTFKSQLERGSNRQMQASAQDMNNQSVRFGGAIVQTPVFFGSQIKMPNLTNQQNASTAIQSAYTLSKHASLEVAEAAMTITGSERLLGTTNITTSPEHVVNGAKRDVSATNTPSAADFADWSYFPAYVKVNIKMPRDNDDFALFTGQSSTGDPNDPGATDYARDFWFDGYYYVYGIEHIFESGEFKQNLQMIGIPQKSAFDATKNNSSREVDITQNVSSCFDNQIGCGPSTPAPNGGTAANTAVPETPPSGNTNPTNIADANTINDCANTPDNVIGWSKASEAVKAAITSAAQHYGMSVVTMAQMCAIESNFNATAKAPTSSASGLYQFISGTWNGLVKAGSVAGLTKADIVPVSINTASTDPRYNPQKNAYAGAVFLRDNARAIGSFNAGDLYLAHFLGPATAKKVVQNCQTTGGGSLFSSVISRDTFAAIKKANSTIVKDSTTCLDIRTWAANKMANKLTNKPAKAAQTTPPPATATTPATPPAPVVPRTADQPIASIQNCATQSDKKDVTACGPTAQTVGETTSQPTTSNTKQ